MKLQGMQFERWERMVSVLEESLDLRDELDRVNRELARVFNRHYMIEEFAMEINRNVQEEREIVAETDRAYMAGVFHRCIWGSQ